MNRSHFTALTDKQHSLKLSTILTNDSKETSKGTTNINNF